MKKKESRYLFKEKRLQLLPFEIEKLDDLLLIQFQKLIIDIPSLIMTYSPVKKLSEFDPKLITDYCYFKNPEQQLFYPLMVEHRGINEMIAVIVDDNTLFETNKYGIDEPIDGLDMLTNEIDLILVPLLCFDKKGYRVGYGKGYYDRFLSSCRSDCLKIGFSYFEPVDIIEDVDKFDIKLNYCITPRSIFTF